MFLTMRKLMFCIRIIMLQCKIVVPEAAILPMITIQLVTQTKQTPWPLVRERTIPTDRPPLVDEI
jgi:hypothetical protein